MKQSSNDVRKRKILTFVNALSDEEIDFIVEVAMSEAKMRRLMKRFDECNEGDLDD